MKKGNFSTIKHPLAEGFFALYTFGYLILSVLPMVKYTVSYLVSGLYCLSFLFFYFFHENQSRKRLFGIEAIVFMGIIQGAIIYLTDNGGFTHIINEPIRALRLIIPCYMFYYVSGCSKGTKLVTWLLISALFLYISIVTLIGLSQDAMLARNLASGGEEEYLTEYRMHNMGGFEFSYALGLMLPLFVLLIFEAKYFVIKLFSTFASIYILYYILDAQYMILFIVGVASLFLLILFGAYKPQVKLGVISISIALFFIASPLLRWLASFLDSETIMYRRLINFANVFDGKLAVSETSSRLELYVNALTAFLTHPFFGEFSSTAAAESHSLFFGMAASTGIIGLTFLIIEFVVYFKTSKEVMQTRKVDVKCFRVSFICYVLLAILNPIGYAYEIAIIVFFYMPLTIELFSKRNTQINFSTKKYRVGE